MTSTGGAGDRCHGPARLGRALPRGTADPGAGGLAVLEPQTQDTSAVLWLAVVHDDPVTLMGYVVLVLQQLFGFSREKATRLMLEVHHRGRAVVTSGAREQIEADVVRLHARGLLATVERG